MITDTPVQLSSEYLRDLLLASDEATNLIAIANARGQIQWVNKSFSKTSGYSIAELQDKTLISFFEEAKINTDKLREIATALDGGKRYQSTLVLQNKAGGAYWLELTLISVTDHLNHLTRVILSANDVTERVNKNEELLYSEMRWKFALEKSGDGYFEYNFADNRFWGSDNLMTMLGLSEGSHQLDFTSLVKILHPEDSEAAVSALFDLISGRTELLRQEIRLINGAETKWIIIRATVTNRNTDGSPVNLIGTTTDISKLKEVEAELLKAKINAERASEYKNRFLATMSHEIRTPLNGIIGLSNLMLLQKPEGETKENLTALLFSANHLLSLINDILDLSKIEAGKIEFAANEFNLREIIEGIYQTFIGACTDKKIELSFYFDEAIPPLLIGDRLRLTQILNNLVNNAIKFTEHGQVSLRVKLLKTTKEKTELLFQVIDTGIGISPVNQKKIFDDFVQADMGIVRKYGGTGLGLSITKKLVELQGGSISVESALKKGSTFSFQLPFNVAQQSTQRINSNGIESAPDLGGVNILLAEDIPVNKKVAVSYLTHWQAKTTCADNGKQALAAFKTAHFDLLIIDLYMPEMDGFETIRHIRKLKKGKAIPIIALTASADSDTIAKAIDSGADACLSKPFDAAHLLSTIKNLLGRKKEIGTAANKNLEANGRFKYINLQKLEEASLGKAEFIAEMIELLKKEIPDAINEATHALSKHENEKLASAVHKLKNSLLLIGLSSIEKDLKKLELDARANTEIAKLQNQFDKILLHWKKANAELNSI